MPEKNWLYLKEMIANHSKADLMVLIKVSRVLKLTDVINILKWMYIFIFKTQFQKQIKKNM